MRQKLNLITLGVENFERSLHFYQEGLGWKKSEKSMDDFVLFPLGGITLAIYPRDALAEDVTLKYQQSEFYGITLAYNTKSEREVDEVLKRVVELGGRIVKPA